MINLTEIDQFGGASRERIFKIEMLALPGDTWSISTATLLRILSDSDHHKILSVYEVPHLSKSSYTGNDLTWSQTESDRDFDEGHNHTSYRNETSV